jgi:hypothetical protein
MRAAAVAKSDAYTYGNSNTDRDTNSNTYTHPDTDPMHWEMCTHTEAAPDSGTAPVACNVSWKR